MKVADICSSKVVTVSACDELIVAAHRMRERHVGFLVVVEPSAPGLGPAKGMKDKPIGVLTDRDLVMAVLAGGGDAWLLQVRDVMTRQPMTAREDETVSDVLVKMRAARSERLPVISAQGSLVGVLSMDAALACVANELEEVVCSIRHEQRNESAVHA